MAFIGKITTLKIKNKELVMDVPAYHRAATGMRTDAVFYAIPYIDNDHNVKEVIISPIEPKNWKFIYGLEITAHDEIGLINTITKILLKYKINIYIQDFLTTKFEGLCQFNMMIDLKGSYNDLLQAAASPKDPHSVIEECIFKPLKEELREAILDLYNRNRGPQENLIDRLDINFKTNLFLKHYNRTVVGNKSHRLKLNNKKIVLGKGILNFLRIENEEEIQCTTVSDVEEKIMRIRFFGKEEHLISLDIRHTNVEGSIFAFSQYILDISEKRLNIISCYNRLEDEKSTSYWNVIINITHHLDTFGFFLNFESKFNEWKAGKKQSFKTDNLEIIDYVTVVEVTFDYTKGISHLLDNSNRKALAEFEIKRKNEKLRQQFKTFWKKNLKDTIYITIIVSLLAYIAVSGKIFTQNTFKELLIPILGIIVIIEFAYRFTVIYNFIKSMLDKNAERKTKH